MKTDDKVTATGVAQTIYDECANFLNKKDLWTDKTKFGPSFPTEVPFAPRLKQSNPATAAATPAVPATAPVFPTP